MTQHFEEVTPPATEATSRLRSDSDRLTFVCGIHQSGKSLLLRLLAAHPEVSVVVDRRSGQDEGQHLQTMYPAARAFGGVGAFGFHPEAYMDESHPLVSAANAERLLSEWSRYWDLEAGVLIEGSPPNLIRTRFLQALFPAASFIVVLRHPVAVCSTPLYHRRGSPGRLLEHWVVCHEIFARDRPHLRRVLVLRYEDLVSSPEETLADVFGFLGVDPIQPVEPLLRDDALIPMGGRGHRLLERLRLRRSMRRLEARVRPFGYTLTDSMAEL